LECHPIYAGFRVYDLVVSTAITKNHREIWSEFYERPELSRILDPKADLAAKPVTNEEKLFVNFLIFHLNNSYQAIRDGLYHQPEGLKKDIASFFSLPIPQAVWAKAKKFQDRRFWAFVEYAKRSVNANEAGRD
jgi:hypothetical protein